MKRSPISPAFGRDVVGLTAAVWAVHFGAMLTRAALNPMAADLGGLAALACTTRLGVATCLVTAYATRDAFRRGLLPFLARAAGLSLVGCVLTAVLGDLTYVQISDYFQARYGVTTDQLFTDPRGVFYREVATFVFLIWVYLVWLAALASLMFARQVRERDLRLAEAERAAREAQLLALRLQINPHFLFNALNAVASLIGQNRAADAEATVVNLSQFMRYSLRHEALKEVSLREELEAQQRYLNVEALRFRDRLLVSVEVPETLKAARVPSLLLQPLTENTVKYAVAATYRPVRLTISARQEGPALIIVVEDDGPASMVEADRPAGAGIGLANVEARLRALYGEEGTLDAGFVHLHGFRCALRLPLRCE